MDILDILFEKFRELGVNYGVVDGFSRSGGSAPIVMHYIDILIDREDMMRVHPYLEEAGYKRIRCSSDISQYLSNEYLLGTIDFIHAYENVTLKMLDNCCVEEGPFGAVRVLRTEDVVGIKLLGIYNDPSRERVDFMDIEQIVKEKKKIIDWDFLEEYFLQFDMFGKFDILKERYGSVILT